MTRRRKKEMPLALRDLGDAALCSQDDRAAAPEVWIERSGEGWTITCPHRSKEDIDRWWALFFGAFGTRSCKTVDHFINTLVRLCGNGHWDEERHCWMPDEGDFQAALNIVNSLRPRGEAEAAYAAQLVALHLSAMKLGEQAGKSYSDPRTAAILAKTVRAYGDGLERLANLQGKVQPRSVHQTIQVVYVDHRDQRSVRFSGGCGPDGSQPQGTERSTPVPSPALPSPRPIEAAMSLPRGKGQAGVPNAWWGARLWRSLRAS